MPHRALTVDDILREVTVYVTDTHPPTTVALACCAKFLEEPALSPLWKIQNELPPLIKTLPPDSWVVCEMDHPDDKPVIVRNPPQLHTLFSLVAGSKLMHVHVCFGYRYPLEPCRRMIGSGSNGMHLG